MRNENRTLVPPHKRTDTMPPSKKKRPLFPPRSPIVKTPSPAKKKKKRGGKGRKRASLSPPSLPGKYVVSPEFTARTRGVSSSEETPKKQTRSSEKGAAPAAAVDSPDSAGPSTKKKNRDHPLVGRYITKYFIPPEAKRKEVEYIGIVDYYHTRKYWFRVIYNDGDIEDLTREQLEECIVPKEDMIGLRVERPLPPDSTRVRPVGGEVVAFRAADKNNALSKDIWIVKWYLGGRGGKTELEEMDVAALREVWKNKYFESGG